MLASKPQKLDVHNDTLRWVKYKEGQADNMIECIQLFQVSTDSKLIVTCEVKENIDWFCLLRVWDSSTFKMIGGMDNVIQDTIYGIQISHNNKWIMYYSLHNVYVFETYNLKNPPILEFSTQPNYYQNLDAIFTLDSNYVLTCGQLLMKHSIKDKQQKLIVIDKKMKLLRSLKCGKNILIYASVGVRIQVQNIYSHVNVHHWYSKGKVDDISLSNNENIVVSIGRGDRIKMWSTQTKKLIRKYGERSDAFDGHVNLSPDGQLMISHRAYEDCLLWNLVTGDCTKFENAIGFPTVYNFTLDGKFIVRSQPLKQQKIWNISQQSI